MARSGQRHRRSGRPVSDDSHENLRNVLRVVGPLLIVVGLGFFVAGIISFDKDFNERRESIHRGFPGFSEPQPKESGPGGFWMCFLGVPLMGIGGFATKVGFLGTAARYVVHETRDSVSVFAGAVAEGIRDGSRDEEDGPDCPSCGVSNDVDARFCDGCGASLTQRPDCSACGKENDAAARFCNGCGAPLDR